MDFVAYVHTKDNKSYLCMVNKEDVKRALELKQVKVGDGEWETIDKIEFPYVVENNIGFGPEGKMH